MKISAFPKCWIEDICEGRMSLFEWIDIAAGLECEGLELYPGFLKEYSPAYLASVREAVEKRGMTVSMMCHSPDFTVPPDQLNAQIEAQCEMIRITAELGGGFCRTLSGQRRPGLLHDDAVRQVVRAIKSCLPAAEQYGVVLAMENHFKDGYWHYPEFAQKQAVFLEIIGQIDSPWFGVQYDPSNTIVAGEDPLELLDRVLKSDSFERIDLILVSHGPFDHVGDTAKLAKKHGCRVLCPDDVMYYLIDEGVPAGQIIKMCWGLATEIGGIRVKAIENHHRSVVRLKDGNLVSCPPVCYIITLEDGTRVYNSGDTALFSDMKLQGELYRPHIGLINVSGDFVMDPDYCCAEMSPYEAALASQWLGVEVVLCCHYVSKDDAGAKEYLEIMAGMQANKVNPVTTVMLEPGGVFEYSYHQRFKAV